MNKVITVIGIFLLSLSSFAQTEEGRKIPAVEVFDMNGNKFNTVWRSVPAFENVTA